MKAENENQIMKHIKAGLSAAALLGLPLAAQANIDYEGESYSICSGSSVDQWCKAILLLCMKATRVTAKRTHCHIMCLQYEWTEIQAWATWVAVIRWT